MMSSKNPFKLPLAEIVIDRLPRTEFPGKKSPLAASLVDIKDSVHGVTKRMFSGSFLRVDNFFDNLPLIVSEVG